MVGPFARDVTREEVADKRVKLLATDVYKLGSSKPMNLLELCGAPKLEPKAKDLVEQEYKRTHVRKCDSDEALKDLLVHDKEENHLKAVSRFTLQKEGCIPGMRIWVLDAFNDKGERIARIAQDYGSGGNAAKFFTFEGMLKMRGYCLTTGMANRARKQMQLEFSRQLDAVKEAKTKTPESKKVNYLSPNKKFSDLEEDEVKKMREDVAKINNDVLKAYFLKDFAGLVAEVTLSMGFCCFGSRFSALNFDGDEICSASTLEELELNLNRKNLRLKEIHKSYLQAMMDGSWTEPECHHPADEPKVVKE